MSQETEELKSQLIESARARAAMYWFVQTIVGAKPNANVLGMLTSALSTTTPTDEGLLNDGLREMAACVANPSTSLLMDIVVDYGLAIKPLPSNMKGMPDEASEFLAVTCSSQSVLTTKQAEALEADDLEEALRVLQTQSQIHADRLTTWLEGFCDKVEAEVKTDFYRGACKFIRGFGQEEALYIEDSIAAVEELIASRE